MSRDATSYTWLGFAWATILAFPSFSQASANEQPDTKGPVGLPTPQVFLAPIEGFEDDALYIRSIADRAGKLDERAAGADDVRARIDLHLAAANLILGYGLEPACTARVLRIAGTEPEDHPGQLQSALDRVRDQLDKADALLNEARKPDEAPGDELGKASDKLRVLRGFLQALQAYLIPNEEPDASKAPRQAASRLSVLLEDDDPRVVAAATLWYALLRGRSGDPSRAMSVLPLALSEPDEETLLFSFFARLHRCRLIAARDGHAAALALLTQIEERCHDWFPNDVARADALRATTLVEIQILGEWHECLEDTPGSAQRQWCADRVKALIEERFGGDGQTVLRLSPTVPIVAPAPAPEPEPKPAVEGQTPTPPPTPPTGE